MAIETELERFLTAQEKGYARVQEELRTGCKQGHWMWFVFPQLRGLGRSAMAHFYALDSLVEARDYLAHPLLGRRLCDSTALANHHADKPIEQLFAPPDNMKFHSCMTLFKHAAASSGDMAAFQVFQNALDAFFAGREDGLTLELLGRG